MKLMMYEKQWLDRIVGKRGNFFLQSRATFQFFLIAQSNLINCANPTYPNALIFQELVIALRL